MRRAAASRLLFLAAVAIAGAPPASAWQARFQGSPRIDAIAVDPAGDVLVTVPTPTHDGYQAIAVVKLSGTDGSELWRHGLLCPEGGDNEAHAIAVDPAGDVVVGGHVDSCGTGSAFTVVKLAGSSGNELWRYHTGGNGDCETAAALLIDAAGDVVAGGAIAGTACGDFLVVKLSGAGGGELWRYRFAFTGAGQFDNDSVTALARHDTGNIIAVGANVAAELSGTTGEALWFRVLPEAVTNAVAVDGSGDALLAVSSSDPGGNGFGALKLSGTTGDILWRGLVGASDHLQAFPYGFALDADGDPIAAGVLETAATHADFAVAKFDGRTGAEQWRRIIDGTLHNFDIARSLALDPAGDVVVAGQIENRHTCYDFAVVKLSGATGDIVWRRTLDGTAMARVCDCPEGGCGSAGVGVDMDDAQRVAVDASGRAVVGGVLSDGAAGHVHSDAVVMTLSDALAGQRLSLDGRPGRRRLALSSIDTAIVAPAPGGPADPTKVGGSLGVTDLSVGEDDLVDLPASRWTVRRLSGVAGERYDYRDPAGPCRRIVVQTGKLLRARCSGLAVALGAPGRRRLSVQLRLGTATHYCVAFGGAIRKDTPTRYEAFDAPAPRACP